VPQPKVDIRFTAPPVERPVRTPGPTAVDPPVGDTPLDAIAGETADPYVPPRQIEEPRVTPTPPPVRVAAQLDSRSDLQPPYPDSEIRRQREGTVVIRVTIGANGRVTAASKVSATSDAFYAATERHARSEWRFRPATVDGRPIESQKTMTVQFRLDN
jgi:protein TonB